MPTNKIKNLVLALLLACLPFTVPSAHAVSVGPLDGKSGPALRPLGSPDTSLTVEDLPDTGFPKELERMGDLTNAAMEWQRLAYKSHGAERELALTNATRLHIALGHPDVAVNLLSELLTENPATPYAPEALYHIATGPQGTAQTSATLQLEKNFTGNKWSEAALLANVWKQAEAGKITNTYGLAQGEELKKRIKTLRRVQQEKIAKAGAFGVILPGAGHAFAGNIPQGLTVLIVFCMFTLAFLSACRHRHYAYSFLFVIPAAALWLTSPVVAMQLVRDETQRKLESSLKTWTDLHPTVPQSPANTSVTPAT